MSLNIDLPKSTDNLFFSTAEISGIHFKIFSSVKGINHIYINKENARLESLNLTRLQSNDPLMFNVVDELAEYFNSKRKTFDVPLDLKGSDFQIKVWNELLKIPYGKAISYKELSERLGDKNLVRAVGKANGSNPVPVIVPCHRVINSDGSLGGYSAGIPIKEKLLELEGILSLKFFN
jgi:methylated-DNA-[protein]-cysteine S-methyltransferase